MGIRYRAAIFAICLSLSSEIVQAQSPPLPTAKERRDYEILIKNKPQGKSTSVIAEFPTGEVVVATKADVRLNFVVYEYVYQFDGKERWQNDQLISFECKAVDGGTQCATKGAATGDGTRVAINDAKPVMAPLFAVSTNYWRLPRPDLLEKQIPIIDTDTGKTFNVKFHRVGGERLRYSGKEFACTHYQVSGDRTADLWFDENNRLVRQTCVEDGYPTEARLTATQKLPLANDR